jgi:hypothetical protein
MHLKISSVRSRRQREREREIRAVGKAIKFGVSKYKNLDPHAVSNKYLDKAKFKV